MLLPVAEVDEVIVLQPAFCVRCQQSLDGDDPQPQRHHVFEIPPIRPVVTEDQWHRLSCPGCGEATPAAWPAGVPRGMMGPRAQAVGSLCPGAYRLSKRTTQRVLDDLCGLQVSVGTISQLEAATTEAVAAPVEEARTFVQEQSSAHLDETGWREGRQRAWLWVAATTWVTVFVVRLSRGGQVARAL
jgi:transposase